MRFSVDDLVKEVSLLIVEVERELTERKLGIPGDGTVTQLQFIGQELNTILRNAKLNKIPRKEERHVAFARLVVDEWDVRSSLGRRLSALANRYERMKSDAYTI